VAAFLTMVLMQGTFYTFGIFFKPLSTEFGWTRALTSGAFSVCMILQGALAMVTGKITDRFGPRVVLSSCGFFLGLGYLLMSQINAVWQLYLFYGVLIATGMSGATIPQLSTVARWFVRRRGLMTGVTMSGIGAGTMIIPLVANWLISNYGWSTSYAVMGFIVFAVIVLAAQFLRRDPTQRQQLPYGKNEIPEESLNLEAGGFSLREAMHTRQFWLLCVAYLGFGLFLQTIMVHIVPHATEMGISATLATSIFVALGVLSIVGRIAIGSASDRIGSKLALIICFILTTVALAWLLVAERMWMFYLFAAVFSFGFGGIAAMESPLVAELFGLSSHGMILGVILFALTIGGTIGPVMAGGIFDITGSYDLAFLACATVSSIGLISTALLTPTKKD
jgi:MFS family permease